LTPTQAAVKSSSAHVVGSGTAALIPAPAPLPPAPLVATGCFPEARTQAAEPNSSDAEQLIDSGRLQSQSAVMPMPAKCPRASSVLILSFPSFDAVCAAIVVNTSNGGLIA
jgi:hypothetical protein